MTESTNTSVSQLGLKKNLYRLKCYRSLKFKQNLEDAERLNTDALKQLNWRRRLALVRHCAVHVPYYREQFKAIGFLPGDLKTEADYARLPILEKAEVREHQQLLISETADRSKLTKATTGGTTGEPLSIYSDPNVPLSIISWRMLNAWGVDVSNNSGYLYRAVPTGLKRTLTSMALYPTRRAYIAAAEMSHQRMADFLEELKRIKPRYLVGYVGAIDAFADYFKDIGAKLPTLKAIWTTAAPLPQLKRRYFEEVFDCRVYTQYGCVETYMIAAECQKQNGLHIYSDIRHVDIVEGSQPVKTGETGDILVSDLTNYAFPLLRYRLGDRGRLLNRSCSCGSPFPLMDYVKGRISDQIYFPDGTSVPGEYWTTIFDDHPNAIKSFQVYQRADYSVMVNYDRGNVSTEEYLKAIQSVGRMLENKLGGRVALSFHETTIDNNENGKTRFVKSEISASKSV
jgi:phenylacetate-CoA ligase